ncbi:MAG: LL-diaminopimelate aminotransferase [Archaeoglobi archaeon]|nr:LL-diaminopimelate aminotransferase [Archaeoglobi archaeon]
MLPPYLFARIDELKRKKVEEGVKIIDLGVGDPDHPTPEHIVEAMREAVKNPETHRYPSYEGMREFREAVARWYERRWGVELDPDKEVLTLIGSKEGIAHTPLAFVDRGDKVLYPDPGYPVYRISAILADGKPVPIPLREENDFLPDLSELEEHRDAKLMFLNYPNNPTSAVADEKFFREISEFCRENGIILCHDNAYSEISFDGYESPSILQTGKEMCVEFHSLSKTYNMTGWRIGFVVGDERIIKGIAQIKTNVDSGVFNAVQIAGIAALEGPQDCVERMRKIYRERRDVLVKGLQEAGLKVRVPKATFYVWAKVPEGYSSVEYSMKLLDDAGVVATPGVGFGEFGEGYIRFALTKDVKIIEEAVERIKEVS